jgi:hypothetical protein
MDGTPRKWVRGAAFLGAAFVLEGIAFLGALPIRAEATPAYARRYDVQCSNCHSPLPPRLNNVGMVFRRAGLRLPDADESGKLQIKTVEAHGIGDAAAMSAAFYLRRAAEAVPGENRTSLQMGEVAVIAGTAVGEHYSLQGIFIPRSDEGEVEFEMGEVQANFGKPEQQLYVRGGLTQTLMWQKANEGLVTLSAPLVFDESPYVAAGDFAGFAFGQKQTEVEAGFMQTKLNRGRLRSAMVSVAVLNGFNPDGSAASVDPADGADYLIQAAGLLGSSNTVTAFYYNGRTLVDPAAELDPPGPFKSRFTRLGAAGSAAPIERLEVTAGVVSGDDQADQLDGNSIRSLGGYGEANFEVMPHWIVVYRFDQLDPNTDASGDLARAHTLSSTCQLQDFLFLTAEYREVDFAGAKSHDIIGRVRWVY